MLRYFSYTIVFFFINANALYAQTSNAIQKSLLPPILTVRDSDWAFIVSTENIIYSYDNKKIERLDSNHVRVSIKEMPKQSFFKQIRSQKMMEHRSLQNYDDKAHLIYDYEGFENYSFTIVQEEINLSEKKFKILKTMDYNVKGDAFFTTDNSNDIPGWKTSIGAIVETAVINLLFTPKAIGYKSAAKSLRMQ